ncbi:hypothetical protein QE429_003945 [Bacillus sp. SORGH_AS 510]|uniref:BsuPI-related putative proteinase inhibitor n=1 Tax=Bacillus sp. SORGH_AS_0510 TaxID=3041771 RepID=UPI00278368D5|nr:BsuPI-related putative proteinase inhibitor [Bacillus sp. SORGH_AS_0510]MDQ1147118.1 hypothetical protein [Bacillus sp. SORGH_AS_0510]
MRILFCIIMLLVPSMTKTVTNGVNELDYRFYVVPTVEPEMVRLEIVLENTGDVPLHFEFPTSQLIEMTITDDSGKEVYDYSKGRYFLQAFQTVSIEPHQTFRRIEKWNYQFKGRRIPPGEYTVHTTFRPIRLNEQPITNRVKLRNVQKFTVPEVNQVFRNVKVSGTKGEYVVTGETKAANGNGYYTVEDGHKQYINETRIEVPKEEAEWRTFQLKVHLPKENLPPNGSLIMNLYERGKEGAILHPYPVVLEQFR